MTAGGWAKPDGELGRYITEESEKTLNSYREQPRRVAEDANVEDDTAGGGYARRQLFELIQNSADALSPIGGDSERADAPLARGEVGRIEVRLTGDRLYCADDGEPIDRDGVTALMFSRLSPKRGTRQIGTGRPRLQVGARCQRRAGVLQPHRLLPVRRRPFA